MVTVMPTRKLPVPVTIIGWLFIMAGIFGFAYHINDFNPRNPLQLGIIVVLLLRLGAIAGGTLLLRGVSWSRWILLAWMVYQVIVSATHGASELIIHIVILAGVAYVVLRPATASYFRCR